jgi:hypothetical protein
MAHGIMSMFPSLRVRQRQSTHECRHLPIIFGPKDKMPVVGHQTLGKNPYRRQPMGLPKHLLKRLKVLFLLEQPQPAIRPVEHMVHISTGNPSGDSRHNGFA